MWKNWKEAHSKYITNMSKTVIALFTFAGFQSKVFFHMYSLIYLLIYNYYHYYSFFVSKNCENLQLKAPKMVV